MGQFWSAYQCSRCLRVILAEGCEAPIIQGGAPNMQVATVIRQLYPASKTVDASLPEAAQRYLKQAMDTQFAPDACVVMAASAVDAMLKAKGYEEGSLYSRIDKAVEEHVLTEGMGKWAHKVRLEANAVRHADSVAPPPTEADAKQVFEFASALGDFLFVLTARVDAGMREATTPQGN